MNHRATISSLLLLYPQLTSAAAGVADVANEDPGLFMVMMALLAIFICVALVGLFLFFILLGTVFLLASVGIITFAVIETLYHRSLGRGFRILLRTAFTVAGFLSGIFLLFLLLAVQVQFESSTLFKIFVVVTCAAAGWNCSLITERITKVVFSRLFGK